MKKILAVFCALSLLLSLSACAAPSAPSNPALPDTGTQTDPASSGELTAVPDDPYDEAQAIRLTFADDGIQGEGEGVSAEGTALTISSPGTYLLSGSCADGSVKVKKGTTGVTLVLSGLSLTSADTAPITCAKSTEVVIVAARGTENTLRDAQQNNDDSFPENENAENAVLKCKDGSRVTLCGGGVLTIESNGKNGIKSGMTTDDEGEASLTIRDLQLRITAAVNDAVNAEQLLNVESGNLTIDAADDALHCDLEMNIGAENTAGPTIDIRSCYEGLEAATLAVWSGDISIVASDDCVNAANSDLTDYAFSMSFHGGSVNAYTSGGDGFDSNGTLTITGGTIAVWTANAADNQPLDADGLITVSGGTVLAAGASGGMGMNLDAQQPCLTFGESRGFFASSSGIRQGSTFTIAGADGSAVFTGTAVCAASFVFFSSADLSDGVSYTLTSTGEMTATAQTGASQSSSFPGGGGGFLGGQIGRRDDENGGERPARPTDGNLPSDPPEGFADGTTPPDPPEGFADGTTPPDPPEGFGDGTTPPTPA